MTDAPDFLTYAMWFGFVCVSLAQVLAMVRLIIGPNTSATGSSRSTRWWSTRSV